MANEIFREDKLALEVIATGSTVDNDPGFGGKEYRITTWTFRLNHIGLKAWIDSKPDVWSPYVYTSEGQYEELKALHESMREDLTRQIRDLLGASANGSFSVTQNVTEIFTAVQIEKVWKDQPEKKRTTIAEALHKQLSTMNAMLCMMI